MSGILAKHDSATGDTMTTQADADVTLFNDVQYLRNQINAMETRLSSVEDDAEQLCDSGWQTPILNGDFTVSGHVKYRRANNVVMVSIGGLKDDDYITGIKTLFTLPAAYRPLYETDHNDLSMNNSRIFQVTTGGAVKTLIPDGESCDVVIVFFTIASKSLL